MGVLNLWKLLQPCGRRVAIETLRGEVLAVDVSIWLTQFVKAMRDDEGMMLKNAHVVGTLRRICKLMFHRIRPVFVFDGGTPALKRKTVLLRRQRRQNSAQATERAAQRLLLNHIRQAALRRPKPEPAVPAFAAASGTLGGGASPAEAEEPASPSQGGGSVSGAEGQAQEAHDSDSDGALAVALEESITAAQARAAVPDGGGSASAPLSAAAAAAAAVFDEESDDDGDGDGRDTGQDNSDGGSASRQSSRGRGGGSGPSRRAMWWARVTGDDADSGAAFVPEAEAGRVDADALRALPSSLQQEYIGEIRRQQQQRARRTMLPAAGDPTAFSRVQVMSFLQGAQLNLTVDRINAEQAAAVTEGGRIAGDAGRQFLLQRADGSNVEVSGMQRRAALLGAVGAGRSREEEAAAAEAKAAAEAAARQARRRRLGHGPAGGVAPGADGAAQVDEDEALASALRAAEARQALESGDLTGVLALDGEEGGDGGDGDAGGDDDDVFGFEGVTETMRAEVMEVLDLWGIPYIVAPMEAEAQCAELERMGLVSGVVTDDSDAFLFGARRVYKNIFESAKYVEAYRMEDVEREVGLDRDDLVRAALLLGSDYTDGVRGVGIVNTVEILRAFPGDDGLREFRRWLDGVEGAAEEARLAKEAKKNPEVLESADPALRFRLTHQGARRRWVVGDTFPNRHVLDAYRRPNVSHVDSRFVWDAPDFDALARFAVAKLGFSEQHAAAVLLPVAQELKQRSVQRGIRGFLMGYGDGHRAGVVRSKRLREAVEGLAGKESAAELAKDEPVPADKAVPSGWSHSSVSLPAVPALPGAAPSTRRTLESSPSPKLPARGARPMSGPSKKKPRMRTAADVIKRLLWDASLPEEGFSVGYLDRFVGVLEEPFNADDAVWQDVPEHRIQWFRYRGVPIWQKDVRLDLVFGTAGGAGRTLPGVVSAIDAKRDAEEAEAAQRTELGAAARAEGGSGPEEEAEEHEAAAATAAAATAAAAAPAAVAPAAVLVAAKRPPFAAGKGRAADASSPRGGSTACSDGSVSRLSEDDAATRHALRRAAPTASPFAPGLSRERSASDPGKVSVRPHAGVAAIAARADAALSEAGWTVQPRTEDGVLMAELLPEEASPVGSPVLPSAEAALRIGFASAESPADLASTGVVVECLQLYRLPACDA
ncbi:hypothetical protein FNF29_00891 [Cafeteria roenbergensis]|uniref:XPG-I domain-containing protein n=1 Tax=Cafeteria roenbergensis TaxID=33653 RepID=A0A5A8CX86_CAFRO|nr:hypothetical protein FNF29_00891 [Cafeteria roenbergensis]|eukprot:KAA0156780.1 hypothetical protein FNF29_00891 [Cafeteria roenbergensis]